MKEKAGLCFHIIFQEEKKISIFRSHSWEAGLQQDGAQLRARGLFKHQLQPLCWAFLLLPKNEAISSRCGLGAQEKGQRQRERTQRSPLSLSLQPSTFQARPSCLGEGRGCQGCRGPSAQTLLRESTLIKQTGAVVLCSAGWLPKCLQEDLILLPLMEALLCCSHLSSASLGTGTGVPASLLSLCTSSLIIVELLGWQKNENNS